MRSTRAGGRPAPAAEHAVRDAAGDRARAKERPALVGERAVEVVTGSRARAKGRPLPSANTSGRTRPRIAPAREDALLPSASKPSRSQPGFGLCHGICRGLRRGLGPSLDYFWWQDRLDLVAVDVGGFKHVFDFRRLKLGERRAANPSTRSGGRMSGGPFLGRRSGRG